MGEKQADDVVILDIRPVSIITDFFVICTVASPRQMSAVVDAAAEALRTEADVRPVLTDGTPDSGWVLVDFGDVIAHVFEEKTRAFYDLESMWDGAPLVARMS